MTDKHTPGPWRIEDDREDTYRDRGKPIGYGSVSIYGPQGYEPWIGTVHGTHVGEEDDSVNVANANLIAASPCLLAALRALLEARAMKGQDGYRETKERAWRMAEEAVKRAVGDV